ncbi:MAG: hypothetical protein OES34_11720 [Nitrosopumilus sp.]|nr:hypothetical protein [Nitrosopumilus sp.]
MKCQCGCEYTQDIFQPCKPHWQALHDDSTIKIAEGSTLNKALTKRYGVKVYDG